jgi:carbonic anhydrase
VPPEVVFDQGIGDLFTVRVAGNVTSDDSIIGSIEYAVEELSVPLIMVLGHERCGAVQAAVEIVTKNAHVPGHIAGLVRPIEPAVRQVQKKPGDLVDNAVRENVRLGVANLRSSEPILAEAVRHGAVRIIGGRYDLETGVVDVIV